ncbi:MAG: DUF5343 domain-containing protein [Acidobacteriota bacterium]|nr:DUF5343 domain-containing protein [Acidobacteriota bacterium]
MAPTVPDRIDSSVWPSFSGGMRSYLLASFKFLKLIDDAGKPTSDLVRLVGNPAERKVLLRTIIQDAYGLTLDLTKASPRQLEEAFAEYRISGATHTKALTFFLQAARFCEIPLSSLLGRKIRSSRTTRRRREGGNGSTSETVPLVADGPESCAPQGTTRSLALASGNGRITLTLTFDAFTISKEDRQFLFTLIDQISAYERKQQQPVEQGLTDDDVPF